MMKNNVQRCYMVCSGEGATTHALIDLEAGWARGENKAALPGLSPGDIVGVIHMFTGGGGTLERTNWHSKLLQTQPKVPKKSKTVTSAFYDQPDGTERPRYFESKGQACTHGFGTGLLLIYTTEFTVPLGYQPPCLRVDQHISQSLTYMTTIHIEQQCNFHENMN